MDAYSCALGKRYAELEEMTADLHPFSLDRENVALVRQTYTTSRLKTLVQPNSNKPSHSLARFIAAYLLPIPDFIRRAPPPRGSLQKQHNNSQHNRRLEQDAKRSTIPLDGNGGHRIRQITMVNKQGATNQLPNKLHTVFGKVIAPIEGLETILETIAQRPREDAASDGAAEAAGEPAERAEQASGDVVRRRAASGAAGWGERVV
ncbi:hypothetical protein CIB48_g11629 [Xylaria polymorpha]|nr:hypothetical protein CIB48_g11629 [Xylaria polymorpha]